MQLASIQTDIEKFLSKNPGQWFSAKFIASKIGKAGKQINSQLDTKARTSTHIFVDYVTVVGKQRKLFYGRFRNLEHAKSVNPPLSSWRSRSIC
ncbi:MAG: hypothetical protein ACRC2S_16340 [Waterburya sp.]